MEESSIPIRDGFYEREFKEERMIGKESYGEVFEAVKKTENKKYAVKKITIRNQTMLESVKEFQLHSILAGINNTNRRVVKYFDIWLETRGTQSYENMILFIQMEFYDKTLGEIIEEISQDPDLKRYDRLTPLGYYIASEIFLEILRGVNSLHNRKPQIIHRKLNPQSLRLTNKVNEELVRITDYSEATSHEFDGQSHTQNRGLFVYAAPEVLDSRKYDTRADIYSLGIIQGKLFNVDLNKYVIKR
jgi:serine/threonine protein kinase